MVNKSISGVHEAEREERLPTSGPTMERTKKKVEWRNNLSSAEPSSVPEDRSPMWDHETGHLLSYFLGDHTHQGNGMPSPPTQFSTAGSSHAKSTTSTSPLRNHPMHTFFHSRLTSNPVDVDDDPVPPPTPAIQYYHHSKPKAKPSAQRQKSSNNPLMRMKVSFSSDTAKPGENSPQPQPMEIMSPISPTTMIGPLQEELMLPPPTKYPSDKNQSHLIWLRHINAVAKASSRPEPYPQQSYSLTSIPPPPGVAMPQPISYSNGITTMQPIPAASPMFYSHVAQINQEAASAGETEEKRVLRLERNRESARKSRRRKKERLSHLEEKVAHLYHQIETERGKQINSMDDALAQDLKENMEIFRNNIDDKNEHEMKERLSYFLHATGPNCEVRRAVIEFQYSALKQIILPSYQKFMLWLTLHSEKYFATGKEMHSSRQDGIQMLRVAPGKLSSKQVGEELTNGHKLEDGTTDSPSKSSENGEKANQTAGAFDEARMWPLVCFELSVSVDQEEKYMNTHKKLRQLQTIEEKRSQIAAATKMALHLKEAMLYQSHNAEMRSKRSLIDILTPQQTVKYQEWLASNRRRCKENLIKRKEALGRVSPNSIEHSSLLDVCKRLEEVVISQEAKGRKK